MHIGITHYHDTGDTDVDCISGASGLILLMSGIVDAMLVCQGSGVMHTYRYYIKHRKVPMYKSYTDYTTAVFNSVRIRTSTCVTTQTCAFRFD